MATQPLFDIGNVILAPSPTFARLKDKPRPFIPLLVLILMTLAVSCWYVSSLDFAWFREHMMAAQGPMKPEARAAMAQFLTPKTMMWSSGAGAVLGTPLICAVVALYYLLAGKAMGTGIGYGKWFGFAVWTSIPRLLTVPLSVLQILTSGGRLAPEDMNMVSLNYLLLHVPMSSPWFGFATNLDLTSVWSIALAVLGLKAWTGRSTAACVTVAVLPYAVVYGIWAAKIAFLG
ncbi:YIP1 family protein [Telluria mixta]|uniref:YIP1 family protein n=1 Tax=Telluria mixta TaxID=34071 RepID=A0ABT2BW75_9BURK|nr:YIP1 family protein [Telluria mixta]MCS0629379.1 YIP1 family protein [Telluria mixta]WEM97041.1 YIP1 family protein [Telluria mixta]